MKKSLITGITGQDGSYLAELLISKGYEVHGIIRRSSAVNTSRIAHLISSNSINLHYGDLTDAANLVRIVREVAPEEIYNLGSQSDVKVSWDCPEYTANCNSLGTLRLLEAVRINGLEKHTKFYQASTSELYGMVQTSSQSELTPFYPRSPYAVAKLYAYWICVNYRESFNMFVSNGILFNHESPRRGENFVTRKITRAAARIKLGLQDKLYLGNLSAKRDFGHAKDYVMGMWKILQQVQPSDYVLATGQSTSIRDFCIMVFKELDIDVAFTGTGLNERGIDKATGKTLIEVDKQYFRPVEVDSLQGDSQKARTELGWVPEYDLSMLIKEMVIEDLKLAEKELLQKDLS